MKILFFLACIWVITNPCLKNNQKNITIIGTAFNGKGEANVFVNKDSVFVLDKIYMWNKKFNGKRVIVVGQLVIDSTWIIKEDDTEVKQGTTTPLFIIKNPKYKLYTYNRRK